MVPPVRRFFQSSRKGNQRKRVRCAIGDVLDQLRRFGYYVFNDLKLDGQLFEYLLLGPTGVFAIQTGRLNDIVDESSRCEKLRRSENNYSLTQMSSGVPFETPIKVSRVIKVNSHFHGWIWPLVVLPGEWRVKNDPATVDARLFTKETLVNHIVKQRALLTATEITLIRSYLERSSNSVVKLRKSPGKPSD